ncbi:MAG: Spy/CpxP family protein refolding chaperone [Limnohabitans sp.]
MKSLRSSLITAGLLLGLSGLAFAQTTPAPDAPRAERMEKMREHMGQRHAQHLAELKSKLKLQAAQEPAWAVFEQAMQMPKDAMKRPDRAAFEKMTTPERLDQMQAHKTQMDAQMQKHIDATKSFYATLTAEQKKVFDAETARGMHGLGGEGHHHRH